MYSYAWATRLNKDEVKCVDSRFVKSGVPNVDLSYQEIEKDGPVVTRDLCPAYKSWTELDDV